jgi:transposase
MKFNYFIGVDVSKNTLDFCLVHVGKALFHLQTDNNSEGIEDFINQCNKQFGVKLGESLICMEHTGIYNYPLLDYLSEKQASIWLESALQIKHSSGLQRGKNDKIDAERIAFYAYRNNDKMKLWQPTRQVIKELKTLTALRSRIINAIKQLKTSLKEGQQFLDKGSQKKMQQCCQHSLKALDQDLVKVNKQLDQIIASDEELNRLFNLITSIEGIGAVTAREVLITTNEFKNITEPKRYACYVGVAPFHHRSGTSVRGKTRVSHLANKDVKTLLHMAALSAIHNCEEIKNYYQRKVAEGKNKMSVINAVRNKLVLRIFAVVRNNQKYDKNYNYQLV